VGLLLFVAGKEWLPFQSLEAANKWVFEHQGSEEHLRRFRGGAAFEVERLPKAAQGRCEPVQPAARLCFGTTRSKPLMWGAGQVGEGGFPTPTFRPPAAMFAGRPAFPRLAAAIDPAEPLGLIHGLRVGRPARAARDPLPQPGAQASTRT
jgi:hypothetical protein